MSRLALVTGASRGIGAATARALARDGWHVILTARDAAALEAVEDGIATAGGSATIAPLDLADGDGVGRLADAIAMRWQSLDALVLNAAMLGTLGPVAHIDPVEFAKLLTLNVSAPLALLGAFDALLRAGETGSVIGVTSSVGAAPRAYWGGYGASKAAFDNLLTTYALEHANVGRVRVGIVDPGATRTAMRARAFPGEDPVSVKDPQVVGDHIAAMLRDGFANGTQVRVG